MLQVNIQRINKTIDYIEQNLDGDLSLTELARHANYSPYHFHRMFSNFKGETPHHFVQRKRIEQIAWQLLKMKDQSVESIALRYGFDNHVSFAKSFKKFYGQSASQLRRQSKSPFNRIIREKSKIGKEKIVVEDYFQSMNVIMQWMAQNGTIREVSMERQQLASIRSQGSFDLAEAAFRRLKEWAKRNKVMQRERQWMLIIHDNPAITEENNLNHSACVVIDRFRSVDENITALEIPPGQFLVGTFELRAVDFEKAWGAVSISLMQRGLQFRDGHYFEIFYRESLFDKSGRHKVDICIPIES